MPSSQTQVFLFLTIENLGALNCSLVGLSRKLLTLCASFFVYNHSANFVQRLGLLLSAASMAWNFYDISVSDAPPRCIAARMTAVP